MLKIMPLVVSQVPSFFRDSSKSTSGSSRKENSSSREVACLNRGPKLQRTRLPDGLLGEILKRCDPRDVRSLSAVSKQFHCILHDPTGLACSIWPVFYKRLCASLPHVMNLGIAGEDRTRIKAGASLESMKLCCQAMVAADLIAKLSEDGKSIIITLPAGWSIDKLEALSQEFANKPVKEGGVPSARIKYGRPIYKEILQATPILEAQTIVLSNTVITGSRNKLADGHIKHLKDNKFEEELPDTLTVLTAAVLKRILTKGQMSSYGDRTNDQWTLSRTNQRTPEGQSLFVGCAPESVCVYFSFIDDRIGVEGPRKFRQLELEYLPLESGHQLLERRFT
jgi:hypothetical protein